jgi:hypothetical protein
MLRAGSGRAEDSRSFSQKKSQSKIFCDKDKQSTMLPQAMLPFRSDTNLPPNVQETLAGHAARATGNQTYTRDRPHYPAVRVPSWSSWSSWLVELVPFGRQIGLTSGWNELHRVSPVIDSATPRRVPPWTGGEERKTERRRTAERGTLCGPTALVPRPQHRPTRPGHCHPPGC